MMRLYTFPVLYSLLLISGCGRIGFDVGAAGDGSALDAAALDADTASDSLTADSIDVTGADMFSADTTAADASRDVPTDGRLACLGPSQACNGNRSSIGPGDRFTQSVDPAEGANHISLSCGVPGAVNQVVFFSTGSDITLIVDPIASPRATVAILRDCGGDEIVCVSPDLNPVTRVTYEMDAGESIALVIESADTCSGEAVGAMVTAEAR